MKWAIEGIGSNYCRQNYSLLWHVTHTHTHTHTHAHMYIHTHTHIYTHTHTHTHTQYTTMQLPYQECGSLKKWHVILHWVFCSLQWKCGCFHIKLQLLFPFSIEALLCIFQCLSTKRHDWHILNSVDMPVMSLYWWATGNMEMSLNENREQKLKI